MKNCLSFLCLTSHESPSFTRNVHEKEKIYQEQRYLLSSLSTCLCSTTPLTRQFPIIETRHSWREASFTVPWKTPGAVLLCQHETTHLLVLTLLSDHFFLIFLDSKGLCEILGICCGSGLLPVTCSESNPALCMAPVPNMNQHYITPEDHLLLGNVAALVFYLFPLLCSVLFFF